MKYRKLLNRVKVFLQAAKPSMNTEKNNSYNCRCRGSKQMKGNEGTGNLADVNKGILRHVEEIEGIELYYVNNSEFLEENIVVHKILGIFEKGKTFMKNGNWFLVKNRNVMNGRSKREIVTKE